MAGALTMQHHPPKREQYEPEPLSRWHVRNSHAPIMTIHQSDPVDCGDTKLHGVTHAVQHKCSHITMHVMTIQHQLEPGML